MCWWNLQLIYAQLKLRIRKLEEEMLSKNRQLADLMPLVDDLLSRPKAQRAAVGRVRRAASRTALPTSDTSRKEAWMSEKLVRAEEAR